MINLRYKKLQTGKFSLYFDTYSDGKRKKKFLGLFTSKDYSNSRYISSDDFEVVQKANVMLSEFSSEFVPVDLEVEKKIPSLFEFMKQEFVSTNKYRSTSNSLTKHISAFSGKKDIPLELITETWANEFEVYLNTHCQESTVNTILTALKSLLTKAAKFGFIEKNPIVQKAKHFSNDRPFLTVDEFDLLQNTPTDFNPEIRLAFFFSYFSGLTWEQVSSLTWSQIEIKKLKNSEAWSVTIDGYRNQITQLAFEILKKVNSMYESSNVLNEYYRFQTKINDPSNGDKVFKCLPNKSNVSIRLRLWGAMAGIEKSLCFSMARNSFALQHISNGTNRSDLRKMMNLGRAVYVRIYENMNDKMKTHD